MAGSSADTKRLVLQVDASVELAKRSINDLTAALDRDLNTINKAMERTGQGHDQMVKKLAANGNAKAGMQQLSYQLNDIASQAALGTKGSVIFAQQAGQTIQAIQLMSTNATGFLRFLSGPWGLALTSAAVVLSSFAGKLFETKDEVGKLVEKMREQAHQADLNRQADEAWKHTIEGLTDAIRKRREEQEKAIQSDAIAEQQSLNSARAALGEQRGNLTKAQRDLAGAQRVVADLKANRDRIAAGPGREGADAVDAANRRIEAAEARVKKIQGEVVGLQLSIFQAEANVRGAEAAISTRTVDHKLDPAKKAADDYADAVANLNRERQAGNISSKEFETRLEAEKKKLKDAEEAAKQAGKAVGEFGRQVSGAEAASIARAAGLQVNSSTRTHAEQQRLYDDWVAKGRPADSPVAKPGSSAHEGANGKWALDIQITDKSDIAKVNKVFADKGIRLTKRLVEHQGRVLHIEGSRSEAARAENDAQREVDRQLKRDNNFAEAKDRLNQELLAAQLELVTGIEEQAKAAGDQVKAEQVRRDNAIDHQVAEGELSAAQATELKLINDRIAKQKLANIEIDRQIRTLQDQDRTDSEAANRKTDALRFQDEMARTQSAHRALQLEILDLVYQEKERHLQTLKAQAELAGNISEAARIQAEINDLPAQKARDTVRTEKGTMGPLESWADNLPDNAEFNQTLQVQGLNAFADTLSRVTTGWKDMKQTAISALREITAEIIKMQTLKLLRSLFNIGTSALGAGLGGGGGLGTGAFDFVTPGMGSLSGGGGLNFGLGLPGLASGGWRPIGGRGGVDQNILSINGVPQARVSANENIAILPPSAPRAMLPSPSAIAASSRGGDTIIHAPVTVASGVPQPKATGRQVGRAQRTMLSRSMRNR